MSLSLYRPTGGFFEQAHPVSKIAALVLAFVPPFLSRGPLEVLPYFGLLLLVSLPAGCGPTLRRMAGIMVLLFVMSAAMWSLFPAAAHTAGAGFSSNAAGGLQYGMAVGIRLNCFVVAAVMFLTCTRIEDFTYGLSRLGLPFVVSFTLSLAFRLTPLFMDAGQTIVMAQKTRGLDLDAGGLLARLRRYVPIIVPIMVSGLRRADQLAVALESKGFGNRRRRSVLSEYPLTWRDAVLLTVVVAVCAVFAWHYYAA
jgi:energy-coupling factor transport system permease protein